MAGPTLRQQIDGLLNRFGAEIAEAFRESIAEIKSRITLRVLVDKLKAGDINGAIEALHIDRAAFAPLEDALVRSYQTSGTLFVNNLPTLRDQDGARLIIRFDMRNPRAENWLRDHSSQLVTGIVQEQEANIRTQLVSGMAAGKNPNATGLNIIGRVNRATGRREGGVLGLSGPQTEYVATARAELLSGDPAQLRNYLERTRRDKRFDGAVKAAIESGKPLPAETVAKLTGRYSDRLLQLRGEMIGRTETLTSMNHADDEAFRQGLAKTNYTVDDVTREWDAVMDRKTRHTHAVLDGQKQPGLDSPFQSPSGALMRFPGDRSFGAGPSEIIACRCRVIRRIDFFEGRAN